VGDARGINAVDRELVVNGVQAVEREVRDEVATENGSGSEQAETSVVASVDRQLADFLIIEDSADAGVSFINDGRLGRDDYFLFHRAYCQREVKRDGCRYI